MYKAVKHGADLRSAEHGSEPNLRLRIIYRRIEDLKPDPANPRHHSKKQIRQIADSIKTFGFNVPVLMPIST